MTKPDNLIHDEAHLRVLPDGTIIRWERIPGDRTSEAVAFVRREMPIHDTDCLDDRCRCTPVVWISPGGWAPQTPASAGVTYPATVVHWGEVGREAYTGAELPTVVETLAHGGTWAREKALECAVALTAREYTCNDDVEVAVLPIAEVFARWLDGNEQP